MLGRKRLELSYEGSTTRAREKKGCKAERTRERERERERRLRGGGISAGAKRLATVDKQRRARVGPASWPP